MLDDKLIDYISAYKSPFEDDGDVTQEELAYDGYMKYFRDCMIKSIGTDESSVQFQMYWDEFISSCDEQQKHQFVENLVNKVIKHYRMQYLTTIMEEHQLTDDDLIDLVNFYVYRQWLQFYPKCLSYMSENILNSEMMLKIFITSDYNSFTNNLMTQKRCNKIILEYFKYCSKDDGVETLIKTLKDDLLGNFVEQYKLKNKES